MAMVRAALRGPLRSPPLSNPSFLCSSRQLGSAVALPVATGTTDHRNRAEHATEQKAEFYGQTVHEKLARGTLRSFLNEQRGFCNELRHHLKEQRLLLNSIRGELGLQKIDSEMREESTVNISDLFEDVSFCLSENEIRTEAQMNAPSTPCHTNVASETKMDAAMNAVSTPCENAKTSETRMEVSMNASIRPSCENADTTGIEQPEEDREQQSIGVSDNMSVNGKPIILSEEKNRNGELLARKGSPDSFQHPSWLEWGILLNNLRPYAPAMEKPKEDIEVFDDTAILKRALVKFAQAQEGVFRSLSRQDLIELVQHDLPSMDEKTAAGKKKLQDYLESDKGRTKKVSQAKLTDVVRLVYRAVRSMPMLGGALPVELKVATINVLHVLNSASIAQPKIAFSKSESTTIVNPTPEGMNQEIELAKVNETEVSVDISKPVHGQASPHETNASVDEKDSSIKVRTLPSSLDPPMYGTLKERVDARRERLARESQEKEADNPGSSQLLLTQDLNFGEKKQNTFAVEKSKDDCFAAARKFEAFDALIKSDDSDGHEMLKASRKQVCGASESKSTQKKSRQQHNRNKRKKNSEENSHSNALHENRLEEDAMNLGL